jgi:hypothetical protein
MSILTDILNLQGEAVITDLRQSFEKNKVNASGRLSASLESETTVTPAYTRLTVSALGYIFAAEEGRGPSKNSEGGVLFERILQWIDDKGLNIPEKDKKGVAFAITKKIHEEGTRLYRKGTPSGVLSDILNETRINSIVEQITNAQTEIAIDTLFKTTTRNVKP